MTYRLIEKRPWKSSMNTKDAESARTRLCGRGGHASLCRVSWVEDVEQWGRHRIDS